MAHADQPIPPPAQEEPTVKALTRVIFVLRTDRTTFNLRHSAFELAPRGPVSVEHLFLAGARADERLVALTMCHVDTDLVDTVEASLDALQTEGAEVVVAYSSPLLWADLEQHGLDQEGLFTSYRQLAAERGLHLVDWILCGDGQPFSAKGTHGGVDWWDVPVA